MVTGDRSPNWNVIELLRRGGLVFPERGVESSSDPFWLLPAYNGLHDPEGAEQLGHGLAQALREFHPTRLLIWQEPADIVLGYIVARKLGIPAIRSYDLDGLVAVDGTFGDGGRLVLVADAFREAEPVRAMCALARQQGHEVVAVGALVSIDGPGSDELKVQGVPAVSLMDVEPMHQSRSR